MTLYHIVKITLNTIVNVENFVVDIHFVVLLTTSHVIWRN
jgi:hypothetical protein